MPKAEFPTCRYCTTTKSPQHILKCWHCGGWRNPKRREARRTFRKESQKTSS